MSSQNKFISFCFCFLSFVFLFVFLCCFLVEANNKVDAVYMHLAPTYKIDITGIACLFRRLNAV